MKSTTSFKTIRNDSISDNPVTLSRLGPDSGLDFDPDFPTRSKFNEFSSLKLNSAVSYNDGSI